MTTAAVRVPEVASGRFRALDFDDIVARAKLLADLETKLSAEGMTWQDLALHLAVAASVLSRFRAGTTAPTLVVVAQLCAWLDQPIDHYVTMVEPRRRW